MIKNKGITLIALTITIVILLILAGVAIQPLLGENSLISKARETVKSYEDEQEEEKMKIHELYDKLASLENLNEVNSPNTENNEKNDFLSDNIENFTPIVKEKGPMYIVVEVPEIKVTNTEIVCYAYMLDNECIGFSSERTYTYNVGISQKCNIQVIAMDKSWKAKYSEKISTVSPSIIEYEYEGKEKIIKLDSGKYKIEVWGAQGGTYNASYPGGYGGYSTGEIIVSNPLTLYINIGGQGSYTSSKTVNGGYNGGGLAYSSRGGNFISGSGGGATHIGLASGQLANLTIDQILIAAGGGGGSTYRTGDGYSYFCGGSGGGATGGTTTGRASWSIKYSTGGTQTAGGTGGCLNNDKGAKSGLWGKSYQSTSGLGTQLSGGGGGLYGGGSGNDTGGGGGSGYIGNQLLTNKYMYGYNIATSEVEETKTYSTTEFSAEAKMNTAKEGNGFVRITPINE